jgi:hypothetical protein
MPGSQAQLQQKLDALLSGDDNWERHQQARPQYVTRFKQEVFPTWIQATLAFCTEFPAREDEIIETFLGNVRKLGALQNLSLPESAWRLQPARLGKVLEGCRGEYAQPKNPLGTAMAAPPLPMSAAAPPALKPKPPRIDTALDHKEAVTGGKALSPKDEKQPAQPKSASPKFGATAAAAVKAALPPRSARCFHADDKRPGHHGSFDLQGKFLKRVLRPNVLVRTANGKGIHLVLDTGDSKGLKLTPDQIGNLGVTEGKLAAIAVRPIDAARLASPEPLKEAEIVNNCPEAKDVPKVMVEVSQEPAESDHIIISIGFLRTGNLAAILMPNATPQVARVGLIKTLVDCFGIQQYCNAVQIVPRNSIKSNPAMFHVPISRWRGNTPFLATRIQGSDAKGGTIDVCWDTGAPANVISKECLDEIGLHAKNLKPVELAAAFDDDEDDEDDDKVTMAVLPAIELTDVHQKTLRFTNVPVLVVPGNDYSLVLGWTLFGLFEQILINADHSGKECIGFLIK